MAKKNKTFRMNDDAIKKLELLEQAELKKNKIGLPYLKMTEIVEAAIDLYYTTYLDQDAGDDYIRRISTVVENSLNQYFTQYDIVLDKLLQTALFNKEAELTILKLLNKSKCITRPESDRDLKDFISVMGSVYEKYINDKIFDKNCEDDTGDD